jgi:hypothetical protein
MQPPRVAREELFVNVATLPENEIRWKGARKWAQCIDNVRTYRTRRQAIPHASGKTADCVV